MPTSPLQTIAAHLEDDLRDSISRSGMMFRLFSRAKTLDSIIHKMEIKGEKYRSGKGMIQDIIGLRVIAYFPDDVDVLASFLDGGETVGRSIDLPDTTTFMPQRLNLTCRLPEAYRADFRKALPAEYAQYIDDTYEIQIRTVFSEGWHEVEHDLRYKCKEDWAGHPDLSRALNGLIATLETAEWSMKAVFQDMAYAKYMQGLFSEMLRYKMRIRLSGRGLSESVLECLRADHVLARDIMSCDRMVILLSLMLHKQPLPLTYDNLVFFINRLEVGNPQLVGLEDAETHALLDGMFVG